MGDYSNYPVTMDALLTLAVERDASDVHLAPGAPPLFRINREMVRLADQPDLTPQDISALIRQIVHPEQLQIMERDLELDFSYSIDNVARFRGNVMYQRGSQAVALRVVPYKVPDISSWGCPRR